VGGLTDTNSAFAAALDRGRERFNAQFVHARRLTRGLEPEDLSALSEPFWRKDHARSDRNRFGLGLALSHSLAAKAELTLDFALVGETFRASLGGLGVSGRAKPEVTPDVDNETPRRASI